MLSFYAMHVLTKLFDFFVFLISCISEFDFFVYLLLSCFVITVSVHVIRKVSGRV